MCNIYCTTGLLSFFTGTYTQDSQYIYFPTHVNGSERKRANGANSSRAPSPCSCSALVQSMAPKRSRLSRGVSRHAVAYTLAEKLMHLVRKAGELLHIHRPPFVYHMDEPEERRAMIDMLWTGDYTEAMGLFSEKNEHLVTLFSMQGMDGSVAGRLHERTGPPTTVRVYSCISVSKPDTKIGATSNSSIIN